MTTRWWSLVAAMVLSVALAACSSSGSTGGGGTDGTTATASVDGADETTSTDATDGSNGVAGADGTTEMSGTDGTDGSTGAVGTDGTTGTTETDGTDGTDVLDGTDGTDSPIVINEIVAKAPEGGDDWVEMHNPTAEVVNISGFSIVDSGGNAYTFPAGTTVPALGYATWDESLFGFGLGKDDSLALTDGAGATVDSLAWGDGDAPEGASWAVSPMRPDHSRRWPYLPRARPTWMRPCCRSVETTRATVKKPV